MTIRTSTPPTYLLPSAEEMREAANQVGLRSFSRDLVADLINLAAGGEICPPSSYRSKVLEQVEKSLPSPDSDGEWKKVRSGGYTKDRQVALNERLEKAMAYHQAVTDFLESIDLRKFPGQTPLQQAMSLLKLLSEQSGGSSGGENGETLPIFVDNDNPEKTAKQLSEVMDEVDSLSETEQELLDPEGDWKDEKDVADGDGLDRLKVAEDLLSGKQEILDISRNLDSLSKMQVHRQRKVEVDPNGEEIQSRPLKGLSELARVEKSAWATRQQSSTYFLYQAVSGQLTVRERVTRADRKQVIFILCDGSGSMQSGHRHYKASGVVMNRIKAVINGDAEVYLAVFDDKMYDPSHAGTPEEAKALMKKFMGKNFSGGSTDIAAAIKAAYNYIQEEMKNRDDLYRPEIVVLTDDDSSVSKLKKTDIPETKVHGFAMGCRNQSLVDFCKSTGGVGFDNF